MAVYLPEPVHGESLTSCVGRYGRDLDVVHWPGFVQRLFGYKHALNPAYGRNLNYLAEETRACWGMSGIKIARNLTLVPYLCAFRTEVAGKELEAHVVGRLGHKRSFLARSIGRNRALRYCVRCFESDYAQGQPLYWRLLHQAPAVLACDRHGEWLHELRYGNHWWVRWPAPELANSARAPAFLGKPEPIWKDVSTLSRQAQEGKWPLLVAASPAGWTHALGEFYSLCDPIDRDELHRTFCSAFGVRQLEKLGLRLSAGNDWLSARLCGRARGLAPFTDVLITAFCHSLLRRAEWPGWQPCVNAFATHGEGQLAQWISQDARGVRAACICGSSFSIPHRGLATSSK
ncbi:TniQ family protein [Paraburkholderia sp. RL17-337-BIB-A]|jgi:hypothetical protein|uniref:TniQ family protein n=1 Tax=Paraburkholderia sp. RL17-337-BIB-A TaxID=3031636 RepID=UPI0038BB2A75